MASNRGETARTLGTLGSVGLSLVVAIVLGTWGGHTVDRWLGTSWVMILGFFLGFVAGVLNVYRTVAQATAEARSSSHSPDQPPADRQQPANRPIDRSDDD